MRKELLIRKNGERFYSFVYYKEGQRIRLSREYIKQRFGKEITSAKEADEILKILSESVDCQSKRVEERITWQGAHSNIAEILENYRKWYTKRAPNSVEEIMRILEQYVFYYFVQRKNLTEIEEWPKYYDDFREWLEDEACSIRYPTRRLAYATKNSCIKSLNNFMRYLHIRRFLTQIYVCEYFQPHFLNKRSLDDLITQEEMEMIYQTLLKKGQRKEALFFRLGFFTGMRFNELFGLAIDNVYKGNIEDQTFARMLEKNNMENYLGYLVFDSQPANNKSYFREANGEVLRKPLKNKKLMSEREARTLTIYDEELWQGIIWLYNEQVEKFHQRAYTDNVKDYLLFDDLTRGTATTRLYKAYEAAAISFRSWHCLRHSRATLLIGETGDMALARLWLGHGSYKTLERYNHLYQAIIRKAKKEVTVKKL